MERPVGRVSYVPISTKISNYKNYVNNERGAE
jgi:hypothetical protein